MSLAGGRSETAEDASDGVGWVRTGRPGGEADRTGESWALWMEVEQICCLR